MTAGDEPDGDSWEATLYDWHNEHRLRRQRADVPYWLATTERAACLLVLGAGTGRVATPLARVGHRHVTAVDASAARLRQLPRSPALTAVCGDLRSLPFSSGFDAAVVPYSTGLLLALPTQPRWWHLIPVRDHPDLAPTAAQRAEFQRALPAMGESITEHGIDLVADETMFADAGPQPCEVPQFTAYASGDTGELFGCNMLSHRDLTMGTFIAGQAEATWLGPHAAALRQRCREGTNDPCGSCDRGSRAMNHMLRALAITHDSAGRNDAR